MPTYEYKCDNCGTTIDFKLSVSDRDSKLNVICQECGAGKLIRPIGVVAFGDPVKMGFSGKSGHMKEVLQKIHERTPGSRLNEVSTINKI